MELESSIACYLDVRLTLKNKFGVLQMSDLSDVTIRLEDQKRNEIEVDVTEAVKKSKDALNIIEAVALDVFVDQAQENKKAKQFKSFKE